MTASRPSRRCTWSLNWDPLLAILGTLLRFADMPKPTHGHGRGKIQESPSSRRHCRQRPLDLSRRSGGTPGSRGRSGPPASPVAAASGTANEGEDLVNPQDRFLQYQWFDHMRTRAQGVPGHAWRPFARVARRPTRPGGPFRAGWHQGAVHVLRLRTSIGPYSATNRPNAAIQRPPARSSSHGASKRSAAGRARAAAKRQP